MFSATRSSSCSLLLVTAFMATTPAIAYAAEATWRVAKLSGEATVTSGGVQQASLGTETVLKPGDIVSTGRNGRMLLVSGADVILLAPNSVIAIPAKEENDKLTTILQKAGSISLTVEKRNEVHFRVETPYLAAVVKGTQFRVDVEEQASRVEVIEGKVEVKDLRSGEFVLVLPKQMAASKATGQAGLHLSGAGALNPVRRGEPRKPMVSPIRREDLLRSASIFPSAESTGLSPDLREADADFSVGGPGPAQTGAESPASGTPLAVFPPSAGADPESKNGEKASAEHRKLFGRLFAAAVDSLAGTPSRTDGRRSHDGDLPTLAACAGFGALVSVAVAVRRRRKRK